MNKLLTKERGSILVEGLIGSTSVIFLGWLTLSAHVEINRRLQYEVMLKQGRFLFNRLRVLGVSRRKAEQQIAGLFSQAFRGNELASLRASIARIEETCQNGRFGTTWRLRYPALTSFPYWNRAQSRIETKHHFEITQKNNTPVIRCSFP